MDIGLNRPQGIAGRWGSNALGNKNPKGTEQSAGEPKTQSPGRAGAGSIAIGHFNPHLSYSYPPWSLNRQKSNQLRSSLTPAEIRPGGTFV